ncbi:MAG: response regulator [Microcoleaceae cyanobacterium]
MRILLLEGDQSTASLLLSKLTASGYVVDTASNGQSGLELVLSCSYDLILLDADLFIPKLEGISFCRHLRLRGYEMLILLLIAESSTLDSVAGLDAGADDCILKPYKLPELLAKIRALLRRRTVPLAPCHLTWGDLGVNLLSAEVTYQDRTISLTAREYSLLELFLSNPQRVFNRNAIIDRLWPLDASPCEGAVTNMIKNLRQKLKSSGVTEELLETVYGLGYRLKAASHAQVASDRLNPKPNFKTPIPDRHSQDGQSLQIFMIDHDLCFFDQLAAEAPVWGFQIEQSADTAFAKHWIAQNHPDLVLVNLSLVKQLANGLVQELVTQFPTLPIVLSIDEEGSLDERVMMSRLGVRYFLHKAMISVPQIFEAIAQVLAKPSTTSTRVMVVDENQLMLENLRNLMQPWGLQVTTLQHPSQFWDILTTAQPDLLLLNLEMSTLRGIDLCQAVRQDLLWKDLPIVVVTHQADMVALRQVYVAGADDFIRTPVSEPELITRILSQIDRIQLRAQPETVASERKLAPLKKTRRQLLQYSSSS